jgi:hypothetical protein
MTTRNLKTKNGDNWFWEETPETIEALKQLHATVKKVNANSQFAGNYPGPLYAPHPHITNDKNKD